MCTQYEGIFASRVSGILHEISMQLWSFSPLSGILEACPRGLWVIRGGQPANSSQGDSGKFIVLSSLFSSVKRVNSFLKVPLAAMACGYYLLLLFSPHIFPQRPVHHPESNFCEESTHPRQFCNSSKGNIHRCETPHQDVHREHTCPTYTFIVDSVHQIYHKQHLAKGRPPTCPPGLTFYQTPGA